jgi:single stranded DNA-binding protein
MRNIAEFALIGRIGDIKTVGSTLRVTIASNYRRKDAQGDWQDDTYWNEITIFSDSLKRYIEQYLNKGDLVHARGRIRQSSYERGSERVYTVNLICNEFASLVQAPGNKADATQREPAPQREDADIPF